MGILQENGTGPSIIEDLQIDNDLKLILMLIKRDCFEKVIT